MNQRKLICTPFVILLWLALAGCANLKAVNNYASTAAKSVQQFDDIGYSFKKHCTDRCEFEAIRKLEIKLANTCPCGTYLQADSVTRIIYTSLHNYFVQLANLSNNELTSYNTDALKTALTEGTFGDISINKNQVQAYSKISTILLRVATDAHRSKKIKQYIAEANEPLQVLISSLHFIVQKNLMGELTFKKNKVYTFYTQLLDTSLNAPLTTYEKHNAATAYYLQQADIEKQQQRMEIYAASLLEIASGHQKLYDSRNTLTATDVKNNLLYLSQNLQSFITAFQSIKN